MDNYNKLFMIIRKTDLLNYDEKNELHLYLMNLKEQVKKQKEAINKAIRELDIIIDDLEEHGNKAPAPSKKELCKIFGILKEVSE